MAAVFDAEDAVLAVRQEIEGLEGELNDEDAAWNDFLAAGFCRDFTQSRKFCVCTSSG